MPILQTTARSFFTIISMPFQDGIVGMTAPPIGSAQANLARGILSSFAQRLGVYYALNDGDIDTG